MVASKALIERTGSTCQSTFEGDLVLDAIDFKGMAADLGSRGGPLRDGRGWLGSLEDARAYFDGDRFVAEGGREHWFITSKPPTLSLLGSKGGPVAAALVEVPLDDGRTVWYHGPRWFVSHPCP
jgi:hypothetical protein